MVRRETTVPISGMTAEPPRDLFCPSQISDASGKMKVSSVAESSPFKQAMLSPEECYILDNGVDKSIFIWKGVNSPGGVLFAFCSKAASASSVVLVFEMSPLTGLSSGSSWVGSVQVKGNCNFSLCLTPQVPKPTRLSAKPRCLRVCSSSKTRATPKLLR